MQRQGLQVVVNRLGHQIHDRLVEHWQENLLNNFEEVEMIIAVQNDSDVVHHENVVDVFVV